jgi:ribosomal protein S12 methylthiotransferase accessory factor
MLMEITLGDGVKVNAKFKNHIIKTDQPVKGGGEDSAPSPFDLFLASIGTCAGLYVKGFCDQRGLPTENIRIIQKMGHNSETRLIDCITLEIKLPADFPEKYKDAVINAANLCAVKKHLANPPKFDVCATIG